MARVALMGKRQKPPSEKVVAWARSVAPVIPAARREILRIDVVVMPPGPPPAPALQRARDVEQRLALSPGVGRRHARCLHTQTIRATAMMVRVIHQRDACRAANGKQVGRRKTLVVVLQGQAAAAAGRKTVEVAAKSSQSRPFVTVSAAAVNVDGVGVRPFGDFGLVFQVSNPATNDAAVGGVEHDELVGMKTGADVFLFRKSAAVLKPHHDVVRLGQFLDALARLRVRLERQNLALNAKSADAVRRTELQRRQQGVGVVPAEFRQPDELVASGQPRARGCGGGAKLDGRLAELAAQAEADSPEMVRRSFHCVASVWARLTSARSIAAHKS